MDFCRSGLSVVFAGMLCGRTFVGLNEVGFLTIVVQAECEVPQRRKP